MLFVFMSQPDFACNPHALWKYVLKNTDHETAWIVNRVEHVFELRKRGVVCELYDTLSANKLLDKADYIITNSYTFLHIEKKPNQMLINLWHGSGIKAHDYYDYNMPSQRADKLEQFFSQVDLLCVHSLDDRFKLSAQLHYDMRRCYVTGQPRLDCVKDSNGKHKLEKLFGKEISQYRYIVFYAPSFRANVSGHSGKLYSDNIFRLDDYNDNQFFSFLKKNNAALVYKLHPIENTAFRGRTFAMNSNCYELTDEMLFKCDIRYTELLNAFNVIMSDYSSIAYDFLALDRPIIYLVPDYNLYIKEKGFVFKNIEDYMPGEKAFDFVGMMLALENAFFDPNKYALERQNVYKHRFDFQDNNATERCYKLIINYLSLRKQQLDTNDAQCVKMPTAAEMVKKYICNEKIIIDGTSIYTDEEKNAILSNDSSEIVYVVNQLPNEFTRIHNCSSVEVADLEFYNILLNKKNVKIVSQSAGVDYNYFSSFEGKKKCGDKIRIGYAGTIDNRIYFAMVQCICEIFGDCEIVFAGSFWGERPTWLNSYANLKFISATYEELPQIIQTFDIAILPFYDKYQETIPTEFFQFLACGKSVVASNMQNLPRCKALYLCASISEVASAIKEALLHTVEVVEDAKNIARENDWSRVIDIDLQ